MVAGNGVAALIISNLGVRWLSNFLMDKKRVPIPIHWSTYITMEQDAWYVFDIQKNVLIKDIIKLQKIDLIQTFLIFYVSGRKENHETDV